MLIVIDKKTDRKLVTQFCRCGNLIVDRMHVADRIKKHDCEDCKMKRELARKS
jgi:hypothetical protein